MSSDPHDTFESVTELAGEPISVEQVLRMHHRYMWAMQLVRGRDVVEIACGSGPGLGLLARTARSLRAGDISSRILARAASHYRQRVQLSVFSAEGLPFEDRSKDALILFEAIYYVADPSKFIAECTRVLRPGGLVLIATANKDLDDFNPSPFSHRYFGVRELGELVGQAGFETDFFGYMPIDSVSIKQRILRPVKKVVVGLGLMPKTMAGKRLLKRLVFGPQVPMPAEITEDLALYHPPTALEAGRPDRRYKVIYCLARLPA